MTGTKRKMSTGRKFLLGSLILIVVAAGAFHIFITRYLPPLVKKRLTEVIVKGSDSLYQLEIGKFDLSFWGGSVYFQDLHIQVDSNRYRQMKEAKKLPPMSCELVLKKGKINGIALRSLIFSKKVNIREIVFDSADLKLARHFISSNEQVTSGEPLWKLIQPRIRSIDIGLVYFADLKMQFHNIDSAAAFHWEFEKSNLVLSGLRIDSASTMDSTRLMFAKDVAFTAKGVKMTTTDGLYNARAKDISYNSSARILGITAFDFVPAMNDQQFLKHFGYQHEIYKLRFPGIRMKNFLLSKWVTGNTLSSDTVELDSPSIAISMDRNQSPNVRSKKGGYPQQVLQKLPFLVAVKRLKATNANVVYSEINDVTNRTGKVNFAVSGVIDNITNDPKIIQRSRECIARIQGTAMNNGTINAVFRFDLADKKGAFSVNSTITRLDANQLRPVFTAMTAVEMQSFSMKRLDYSITGNEDAGTGTLSMNYDNMDLLINKVNPDGSLDKKGLLSFFVNRMGVYKENPMKGEERKASAVRVQRDMTRSFFNLVWKTMFTSAGEIVLRPMAKRKLEKKREK
jgi:hypothetical protein